MSVRALHKQMERRYPDLRGTSYGGIRQYAEGKVRNPRIDLLRAIADVLEVRGDWLAFDEGAMTEEEERRRQAKQEAGGEESPPVSHDGEPGLSWADLIQVVQQSFLGKQSTRLQDDPMARVAVIEAIERLVPLLRALSSLSPGRPLWRFRTTSQILGPPTTSSQSPLAASYGLHSSTRRISFSTQCTIPVYIRRRTSATTSLASAKPFIASPSPMSVSRSSFSPHCARSRTQRRPVRMPRRNPPTRREKPMASHPGSIDRHGNQWRIRLCVGGKRHVFKLDGDTSQQEVEQHAREKATELHRRNGRGLPGPMPVSELLDRFTEVRLPARAPNTRKTYGHSLTAFRSYFVNEGGDPKAHEVRPGHVQGFLHWRREHSPNGKARSPDNPVKARTLAKDRAVLHAVFTFAETLEVVQGNPVRTVTPPKGDARQR